MFTRIFKFLKRDREEETSSSQQNSIKYVEYYIAERISSLVDSEKFIADDLLTPGNDTDKIKQFVFTLLSNNEYINSNEMHYSISLKNKILRVEDNFSISSEDLLEFLPLILNNEISTGYETRHSAILWNTLFDDKYLKTEREVMGKHLAELMHTGHTYHVLDLGTGNGDMLLPLLEVATAKEVSLEIDLIDKIPIFINFLNRKITQSTMRKIQELKEKSVDFKFAFHNYDFIDELWELDKFKQKSNFVIMNFCSEHLSDAQLRQVGLRIKENLTDDGVFLIMEASNETRNVLRSIFSFGLNIYTNEIPYDRINRVLSDVFSSIEIRGNIIELA